MPKIKAKINIFEWPFSEAIILMLSTPFPRRSKRIDSLMPKLPKPKKRRSKNIP